MIRVVDALDAHCQASGLGRFLAAATEKGVMDGTILVSVKFHGSALVCSGDCYACFAGGVVCFVLLRCDAGLFPPRAGLLEW
jgi:hypothetical protein